MTPAFDRLAAAPAAAGGGRAAPGGARLGAVLRGAVARLRAAGIATARQDAEILLGRLLGVSRLAVHLVPDRRLDGAVCAELERLLARRAGHEPLQYILGEEEFCGLRIAVGPGVFIPRPETELLVERAVTVCPEAARAALDLCAGSGAVACALATRRPALSVWAVERSPAAAVWARANTARLGLGERVRLLEGDLFEPLAAEGFRRGDLLVANPPYIARPALAELPAEVRCWEPEPALDGGPDGLRVIERILADAPEYLRAGARVLLEIGHDHARPLRARLAADPRYGVPAFHRDLLGYERVLEVEVR